MLTRLLKLFDKTTHCFVFLTAGCLPAEALLALRILGLFGMICRLPDNILHKMAEQALLTEDDRSGSWFVQARLLCRKYQLHTAIKLLSLNLLKERLKSLAKSKVVDHWENQLRQEVSEKSSLCFFNPYSSSLSNPHPILISPGSNPYEVNKPLVQLRMLSGRYRDDMLMRHWTPDNHQGTCGLCLSTEGDLEHYFNLPCTASAETEFV